jgi:hypothetical protein
MAGFSVIVRAAKIIVSVSFFVFKLLFSWLVFVFVYLFKSSCLKMSYVNYGIMIYLARCNWF